MGLPPLLKSSSCKQLLSWPNARGSCFIRLSSSGTLHVEASGKSRCNTAEGRRGSLELFLQELSGQRMGGQPLFLLQLLALAVILVGAGTRRVGVLCHQPDLLFKLVAKS